jgi:hypothetical protein
MITEDPLGAKPYYSDGALKTTALKQQSHRKREVRDHLVSVARNARYPFNSKIEGWGGEPRPLEKRDQKGPQTGIDVHANVVLLGKTGQGRYVLNATPISVCGDE